MQWPTRSLAMAALAALAACRGGEEPAPTPAATATPAVAALPVAEPPLDRRGLLLAVAEVASLHATGGDDRETQRALDGHPFAIRLRFACPGNTREADQAAFDAQEGVLRIEIRPEISAQDPLIGLVAQSEPESVEGFWIQRPWMLEAACPPAPAPTPNATDEPEPPAREEPDEPAPAGPRIGIARFYTAQDSRTHRRDSRPFAATVQLKEGERPSTSGYDLVLSGRLQALASRQVIACVGGGATRPPDCIVSAAFDRVALASPDGTTLAEWAVR